MKRLSRHTIFALLVTLVACLSGLGLAVVASGQTTTDPTSDYTVPLGDYTTTTPSTVTTQAPPAPQQPAAPEKTATVPAAGGQVPSGGHQVKPTTTRSPTPVPSKTTRSGPTTLAFTGGEPIIIGAAGVALMLGGFAVQRRRRRAARLQA